MSSYKIVLKPGGVGGRNVGVGLTLQKKPIARQHDQVDEAVAVPLPDPFLRIIVDGPNVINPDVLVTGALAFTQSIGAYGTTFIDPIPIDDYTISASNVVAGPDTYGALIYNSPVEIADGQHDTVVVIYRKQANAGRMTFEITTGGFELDRKSVV